jgi:hypothetical protein
MRELETGVPLVFKLTSPLPQSKRKESTSLGLIPLTYAVTIIGFPTHTTLGSTSSDKDCAKAVVTNSHPTTIIDNLVIKRFMIYYLFSF